jgi:hypothetical protein
MCTFESCENPEKMYVTRHDWIYHETQMHRRRWMCTGKCDENFKSKDLMAQHIREKHSETFTETKLPALLDICERAEDPNEPTECPLCPDTLSLSRLQSHLALHLEDLSLFVLPVDVDDTKKEGDVGQKESHDDGSNKAIYNRAVDLDDLPSLSSMSAASPKLVDQPNVSNQANEEAEVVSSAPNSAPNKPITQVNDAPPYTAVGEAFIAVMGQTGTGKSSFINHATGSHLQVGHTLEACM